MIKIEFNGKPFDPATFEDALVAAALEQIGEHVRARVESICDPETGEFPTVVIRASSLKDIRVEVEGSDALLARVREALADDGEHEADDEVNVMTAPRVFLSYASEDRVLAGQIANALMQSGIETWWDQWEIRAGDSLRRKIEEGLGDCTHFLVLLTETSVDKPWVNLEMDTGLVRMLSERIRFLPVRAGLSAARLPQLLRGLRSPEIRDVDADVQQLIQDIHDVTRKPPLGPAPAPIASKHADSRVSPAATAVARVFVTKSQNAVTYDPQFSSEQLAALAGLSEEDLEDALFELRDVIRQHPHSEGNIVTAEAELYANFDALWQPWTPAADARRLAADLVNDATFPSSPGDIAQRYDWKPRRLNPALAYLHARELIGMLTGIGDALYLGHRVTANPATRRFLKSRG